MKFVYDGPGPVTDPAGAIVHPGDEREFPEEPAWGPWRALDAPETPAAPPLPSPAPAPASPPAASVTPSAGTSAPGTSKGM